MSSIVPRFHSAVCNSEIQNGFFYLVNTVLMASDTLILSDPNHKYAHIMIADMFSPDRISKYAHRGVTDIYLEIPEQLNPYIGDMLRGEINSDQFIDKMVEQSYSAYLTEDEYLQLVKDALQAIEVCSRQEPPITLHFASVRMSEEQSGVLEILAEALETKQQETARVSGAFSQLLRIKDVPYERDEHAIVHKLAGSLLDDPNLDIYQYLDRRLNSSIPREDIRDLSDKFSEIRTEMVELEETAQTFRDQIRVDNDKHLVDNIQATRKPGGRVIVMHGAGHGAQRKEGDLDELLEDKGQRVNRVNICYNQEDVINMWSRYGQKDPSDISYYPKEDVMRFLDLNENNIVEGAFQNEEPVSASMGSVHDSPDAKMGLVTSAM
ncbi:MAG: hypothetical protein ACLFU1_01415 [Alphaproteobacteria bacterium]